MNPEAKPAPPAKAVGVRQPLVDGVEKVTGAARYTADLAPRGALVGAILVVRESPWDDAPDGPFVIDLVVDPEYRRRGIATALVAEIAKRSKEWGFETLALRIDSRHLGAAELYGGLGFEEVV